MVGDRSCLGRGGGKHKQLSGWYVCNQAVLAVGAGAQQKFTAGNYGDTMHKEESERHRWANRNATDIGILFLHGVSTNAQGLWREERAA